jgi:hypothetical protein
MPKSIAIPDTYQEAALRLRKNSVFFGACSLVPAWLGNMLSELAN